MDINKILKERNLTKYKLSQSSGVPYTTVSDICNGKTRLEKCSADTLYRLAKVLKISMESLIEEQMAPQMEPRLDFSLYKSNVCHQLKELGDEEFLIETLENNNIRKYYAKKWYPEALYLLAMLDYISRLNNVPICTEYEDLRKCKLSEPLYSTGILAMSKVEEDSHCKEEAYLEAIPEFLRHNIVENEVRDVI